MDSHALRRRLAAALLIALGAGGCQVIPQKKPEAPVPSSLKDEQEAAPSELVGKRGAAGAVTGSLESLDQPENQQHLRETVGEVAAEGVRQGLRAAAGSGPGHASGAQTGADPPAPVQGPRPGGHHEGPAAALTRQLADATAGAMTQQLGPDGQGPLGHALASTASQVAASAAHGAGSELLASVPGCEGPDRRACLEAETQRLGRAAGLGFTQGALSGLGALPLVLAFALGMLAMVMLALLLRLTRSRPARERGRPWSPDGHRLARAHD